MRRSGAVKFPNSVQLFKFCQKVMSQKKGVKVRDQEIGSILDFNPSDCSHWKRGEKNVRSVFALAKLSEAMGVEISLIHDVASGAANLDEAYYEYLESRNFKEVFSKLNALDPRAVQEARERVEKFVGAIHAQCDFSTPPLYLPEVIRFFSFVSSQATDMMDKLSRILRIKSGQYAIQFKKGDLKAQTRMSVVQDLARIIFEGERSRFPELGELNNELVIFEEILFTANILAPKQMLLVEMSKLDSRRNVIAELATLFWAPKSLIGFQLQELVRSKPSALERAVSQESTTSSIQF